MCGIAGCVFSANDRGQVDVAKMAKIMLIENEIRGRDASGISWWEGGNADPKMWWNKAPVKASVFVKTGLNQRSLRHTNEFFVHTRAGTGGSSSVTENNHPIYTGGVMGIHNGVVRNDAEIFRKLAAIKDNEGVEVVERHGEVDSEAIFAAIAYGSFQGADGKPVLGETLQEILEQVQANAAIAWMRANSMGGNPHTMWLARLVQNPLHFAQTKGGSFVFASTPETIHKACREVGLVLDGSPESLSEGTILRVVDGTIHDKLSFTPKRPVYATTTYSNTSRGGTHDGIYVRYLDSDDLHFELSRYIVSPDSVIPTHNDHQLKQNFRRRITSVEDWIKKEKASVDTAIKRHAALRIGDWVTTPMKINGEIFDVVGQIYTMPQKFPDGVYFIVAHVPTGDGDFGEYEHMIIARTEEEFDEWGEDETEEGTTVEDSIPPTTAVQPTLTAVPELEAGETPPALTDDELRAQIIADANEEIRLYTALHEAYLAEMEGEVSA